MARPGISYEDVKTAAINLLGHGINPSIQHVREALGTGSNSTIAGHLKQWQQELAAAPKVALPPTIPQAVMGALEKFWNVAIEEAETAYVRLSEKAERDASAAEHRRDEALVEADKLRYQVEGLSQQLAEAKRLVTKLEKLLLVEQERCSLAEQAIVSAEQRAAQTLKMADQLRAQAEARMQKLEATLDEVRKAAEKQATEAEQRLQYERERGEVNEVRLMRIIDQMRTEHIKTAKIYESDRETWQQREAQLHEQLIELRGEVARLQQENALFEGKSKQLEADLSYTRTTLQELETYHRKTIRLVGVLRDKLKTTTTENSALAEELGNFRRALGTGQ